jgi:hypothetical protein
LEVIQGRLQIGSGLFIIRGSEKKSGMNGKSMLYDERGCSSNEKLGIAGDIGYT